jgi:uncharacterized Zn finger protein
MRTKIKDYPISPDLLSLTESQIAKLDQDATEGEGWDCYCNGYIAHATVFQNKISGRVRNYVEDFFVQITVDEHEITTMCTCDQRTGVCKHVVALLYSWVNDSEGFTNIAESLDSLRSMDKENLLERIGRILLNDPRNLAFLKAESSPEEDFDLDGLFN